MSNDPKSKPAPKDTAAFSISFEDDFEGMPGVTQLLTPKAMSDSSKKKSSSPPPPKLPVNPDGHTQTSDIKTAEFKPSTSTSNSAASLSDFGVQFELEFQMERGQFRYARMKGHAQESLALWQQKFYFQMKLDLQALGVKTKFEEFSKTKNVFQGDVLGLTDQAAFVQIVRTESDTQKCFVLVSDKSLVQYAQKINDLIGKAAKPADEEEFKIELAS